MCHCIAGILPGIEVNKCKVSQFLHPLNTSFLQVVELFCDGFLRSIQHEVAHIQDLDL